MLRGRALLLALLLAACDGSTPADGGVDSGPRADGGADSGPRDGGSRMDAGPDADTSDECVGPPGLYVPGSCTELAPGVRPFRPQHQLWSDGDDKERFVYLPPGTRIDTSNPDRWSFPVGTRMYKTFLIDGVRLETRLLEKIREPQSFESWRMVSFAWSEDQRSVTEVGPFGEQDVLGTQHDIPTLAECIRCHSLGHPDAVNGFSAIQLNHAEGGVTLQALLDEGWLSDPIEPTQARIPGDALTQQALGYLHSNCGSCHGGPEPEHGLDFIVPVGVTEVTDTPTWRTAVCTCSVWVGYLPDDEVVNLRIRPGDPLRSVAIHRMSTRVPNDQMPPIGTSVIDPDGIRILSDWIASLDPTANDCPHGCPWP